MKILNLIRTQWKLYKERRFLKKHGCETWHQYHRSFDPDVFRPATRIKDYYHGYPYIYVFENHKHEIYYWDLAQDGVYVVDKWCQQHCKDKFRFDFLRVLKAPSTANEWHINEIGGGDYIFAAFKSQKDFTWFLLRWS